MNKIKYIGILFFLAVLVSCQNEKTTRVGFLLPNLTDGRYPKDRDNFTEKITQLGGSVEIGDAQNDANLQEQQAIQIIGKGVKTIVICAVNQNLAASIVRYAHNHRVKVIAYERLIQNCDLDYFVAFDHLTIGKQQAGYAVQKKPKGNYVLIGGDKSDRNAEMIMQGQKEILSPEIKSGQIKILYDVFVENWEKEGAYIEMKKVLNLSGEKVDVVLSANDGIASGVIKALNEDQPSYPVIVTGLDADPDACKRIMDGKQSMTVYKPFNKQAQIAALLAMELARGEKTENIQQTTFNKLTQVPTILLQPIVVDSTNIKILGIADANQKK